MCFVLNLREIHSQGGISVYFLVLLESEYNALRGKNLQQLQLGVGTSAISQVLFFVKASFMQADVWELLDSD